MRMTVDEAIAEARSVSHFKADSLHWMATAAYILANEVERLRNSESLSVAKFADGTPASIGQEAFFDWNGKMRSGLVKVFVDAGTLYVTTNICYPTEEEARQAADYRPAKPRVKARKA